MKKTVETKFVIDDSKAVKIAADCLIFIVKDIQKC